MDRTEAAIPLRTGLRPPVLVEPQRLPFNYVVDADDAAVSGATVLDVCFCPRWYRFDVFDAAPGGTVLMCLMLLPVITATATAISTATATAEATMSPNLQKPAQGWI